MFIGVENGFAEQLQKHARELAPDFLFIGVENGFAEQLQKHTWELGPEISYIEYKEPDLMKQKGYMYGIAGSYTYHDKLMLKAEGRFSYGQVDYSSPISGTEDDIDDYIWEFRGLAGYDFPVSKASFLTPYAGIGYRYLNDDSSGKVTSTGARGYERESNYIYSPIGVRLITNLKNGWSVGAMAEYDIFWWGKQISHLSDAAPGYNDPQNRQTRGYGLRGSVELQREAKNVTFGIAPFIRYWDIKESKRSDITWYGIKTDEGVEPKNHSTEYGINLLVRF
jgi:hypothetical protein